MCECKSDIEARLLIRAKEMHPEATGHEIRLTGYAFLLEKEVTLRGVMPFEFRAEFPLRKGGLKRKVEKSSMIFTYCPFCGVKYEAKGEDPEETQS